MTSGEIWGELNERQRFYMLAIFEIDQMQEAHQRRRAAEYFDNTPAEVWRKVWYDNKPGTSHAIRTELYSRLQTAGYVDPGTGSTFKALADRGYIKRHWASYSDGTPALAVTITRKGRKLVRGATGKPAPKKRKPGELKPQQWQAVAMAYNAYPDYVWSRLPGQYGGLSWRWVWLRLRDYPEKFGGALVKEYKDGVGFGANVGITLTEAGRRFYERNYQHYTELYPDIAAPAPKGSEDDE